MGIHKASLDWYSRTPCGTPATATDEASHSLTFTVSELATRGCCKACGSTMTIQYHCYSEKTHLAAGTVVEGAGVVPKVGMHIWVSRKPPWYTIPDDGVERWGEFDPEFERVLRTYMGQQG